MFRPIPADSRSSPSLLPGIQSHENDAIYLGNAEHNSLEQLHGSVLVQSIKARREGIAGYMTRGPFWNHHILHGRKAVAKE